MSRAAVRLSEAVCAAHVQAQPLPMAGRRFIGPRRQLGPRPRSRGRCCCVLAALKGQSRSPMPLACPWTLCPPPRGWPSAGGTLPDLAQALGPGRPPWAQPHLHVHASQPSGLGFLASLRHLLIRISRSSAPHQLLWGLAGLTKENGFSPSLSHARSLARSFIQSTLGVRCWAGVTHATSPG